MFSGLSPEKFMWYSILRSTTKDFALRFSTRSCLLTLNLLSTSDWPWNKIRNILTNSQRFPYSSDDPIVSEKSVLTLSFVGFENNCWFWSITIKNFWYCFFTNSADRAEILPRDTNFWRSVSIWDSQELFLAGFLIYNGVSHTELCTTAYLSGDFLRRWWSSLFIELQNLCRIQTQFYLLQIVFCCKSNIDTFWIFSDILIRGIYLYQIM